MLDIETNGYLIDKELELMEAEQKNQRFIRKFRHFVISSLPSGLGRLLKRVIGKAGSEENELAQSEHFKYGGERRAIRAIAILDAKS